jgi:hypothetical protein
MATSSEAKNLLKNRLIFVVQRSPLEISPSRTELLLTPSFSGLHLMAVLIGFLHTLSRMWNQ